MEVRELQEERVMTERKHSSEELEEMSRIRELSFCASPSRATEKLLKIKAIKGKIATRLRFQKASSNSCTESTTITF